LPSTVQLQSFHEEHGHLTEFAGFSLPLWFKGIIPESLAVRNAAGIFDVSHMGRTLIKGQDSEDFLQHLTTNDVSALSELQGHYSLLCNPEGGIKDDIFVFMLDKTQYLIVYNAANRATDYSWFMTNREGFNVEIEDISNASALFAVQGPNAVSIVSQASHDPRVLDLARFACASVEIAGVRALLSRTGYTGEDGFEILVWDSSVDEPSKASAVWDELLRVGKPVGLELCGLGARDLLRLEAGLCLYGTDIDERINPFQAKLGFVVRLQKDFIGRAKLQEVRKTGPAELRVGLMMQNRVIPRHGYHIRDAGRDIGMVTSGTMSPLLNRGIAMGYVEQSNSQDSTLVDVFIRDRDERAKVTKPPFYDTAKYGYSRKPH